MSTPDTISRFAGTWRLLAGRSEYEFGTPPAAGRYTIEPSGDELLIVIDWTDDCGHPHSVHYSVTPDGKEYAYERPEIAEAVMARFANDRLLETFAFRNGHVAMHAERLIGEDGKSMVITQKGYMPDGQEYRNVQYYERIQE